MFQLRGNFGFRQVFISLVLLSLLFGVKVNAATEQPVTQTSTGQMSAAAIQTPAAPDASPSPLLNLFGSPDTSPKPQSSPWTLLLLIPLLGLKFWRSYKKTGELPMASLLARFSPDYQAQSAGQSPESTPSPAPSKVASSALSLIKFATFQVKATKYIVWLMAIAALALFAMKSTTFSFLTI